MTHELHKPKPVELDQAKNDDDLKYVPVWQGLGDRETPPKGSVQYQEVLEALGKDADEELAEDFDYTDYLASTGQIVFSEDDPRAQKYADNENYQAAANSQVAEAFKGNAEREKEREAEQIRIEKDKDLKYVPVWQGEGDVTRIIPTKGSNEYQEILEELGKNPDEELSEDFDYTDYLASTGQIVFSEDDPRAQKYADNENYQAAANSRVAEAFKGNAEREKEREAEQLRIEKDKDLKYVPVWQGLGDRETPPKGSVQYQEVLEALGKDADEELAEDFDYTDYLASTGQIVFSEDDPRAQKYADNENYQAAANSRVAEAFKGNAEREKEREAEQLRIEKDKDLKYVPVWISPTEEREAPPKNSTQYIEILAELGIEELEEDFDYTDYLASTGQIVFADYDPRAEKYAENENYQAAANSRVADAFHVKAEKERGKYIDPNGGIIKAIYIETPPKDIPIEGTDEYKLLLWEIGVDPDSGVIPEDFDYKEHIAKTRRPKDYPDWLDPVEDIDDRWVDPLKLNTSKTFEKEFEEYQFFRRSDGSFEIKTEEGFDDITGIPKLQFADKAVSAIAEIEATFNQVTAKEDHTGQMFRLYNAAFNRFPDSDGLEYWIEKNGSGENTERQVAESFLASNEFKGKYGENISNEQYVKTLYQNILDRESDTEGYNYWVGQLNNGVEDRSELLLGFAESAENKSLFTEMTGFE
ncbi:hypothetical protein PMN2A_0740 [Prochlorococcus marinus str. NATL2A]|uniref:DUF4214 domain-containing protein n=1 Tax=Prochlorococcus marinus (strain NATL2A) TaxID=59920 RepID=Q46JU7_PROMT|nr:DUF4214 domain-containing protein [Prochlorococcus marinus]AAZ58231.1 hypothetical protein PMN2A_0740 [Prochlorococcus marinus str. NATL2A]